MDGTRFDTIARLFARKRFSRHAALAAGAAGMATAGEIRTRTSPAVAQEASPVPASDAGNTGPEMLFVQSFASGSVTPKAGEDGRYTVTLEHGLGQTIYFSDRPDRLVGASPTQRFLNGLGFTPDNPPNAAILTDNGNGDSTLAVVELFAPVYDVDSASVTYEMAMLKHWQDSTAPSSPRRRSISASSGPASARRTSSSMDARSTRFDACGGTATRTTRELEHSRPRALADIATAPPRTVACPAPPGMTRSPPPATPRNGNDRWAGSSEGMRGGRRHARSFLTRLSASGLDDFYTLPVMTELERITMKNQYDDRTSERFTRRRALIAAGAGLATAGIAGGHIHPAVARQSATPASTDPANGDVLTALRTSRAWINYSPARPFDFQIGEHPVTEEQLREELGMLFDFGFRGIITNAMTYGLEATPRIAKEVGFHHVIAKLWWATDDALEIEKRNLADAIGDVDAIVIGNEPVHKAIFRGELGDDALARLRAEIDEMQQAYGKPVSTGLHRDEWILYPEMATELGDFVFPNLQPWWGLLRNDPETAAAWAVGVFELIQATPGMPADRVIVAQEAAFPSHALPPEATPGATPEHQVVFYQRLIESGMPFIYGFSFDQWYAQESSPPGGYGGLWDDQRQPKPVVDVLDLGPYSAS